MREKLTNDRGQVGIGTLIVFIALVLVAAIAAGVLINTAGFLQTQAEQTGQDSTDQVADNINVIGEVGEVGNTATGSGNIYETRLTVQRSPGSSEIDLSGLSIQWVGDNGFAQLVHVSEKTNSNGNLDGGNAATNVYFIQAITAETPDDPVITADGDRYEIVIPTGVSIDVEDDGNGDGATGNSVVSVNDGNGEVVSTASNAYGADSDVVVNLLGDISYLDSASATTNTVVNNQQLNLLSEGQRAELEITTDSGATRNVVIAAPDTLIDQDGSTVTL
jgi:flagellin FlaB